MRRSISVAVALSALAGCAGSATDTTRPAAPLSPDAFVGTWHSVTPSLEFLRLSVYSTSSEIGTLAAQLTLSGLMWEGRGRIDGDSLVATMTVRGTTGATETLVIHRREGGALHVQVRSSSAPGLDLAFARDE
jgi:hypothetical protein